MGGGVLAYLSHLICRHKLPGSRSFLKTFQGTSSGSKEFPHKVELENGVLNIFTPDVASKLQDIPNIVLAEDADLWVFSDWHIDLDTDSNRFLSEHIKMLFCGQPSQLLAIGVGGHG